jgi:hypothetical protein
VETPSLLCTLGSRRREELWRTATELAITNLLQLGAPAPHHQARSRESGAALLHGINSERLGGGDDTFVARPRWSDPRGNVKGVQAFASQSAAWLISNLLEYLQVLQLQRLRPRRTAMQLAVACLLSSSCQSSSGLAPGIKIVSATQADRSQLISAFAAYSTFESTSSIAGIESSYPRIAYDKGTGTFWALATFIPSPGLPADEQDEFAPPENTGIFSRMADSSWTEQLSGTNPFPCPLSVVPNSIWPAWHLSLLSASQCKNVFSPPSPR